MSKRSPATISSLREWVIYGILIGIVTGFGTALFYFAQQTATTLLVRDAAGFAIPYPTGEATTIMPAFGGVRWYLLVILPAIGGLISGFLVYTFAPEAEGHGTDAVIKAFHKARGKIRWRVPLVKALATIGTLGFGGSAGREGPVAQIGAGFGSLMADLRRLNDTDRRILAVCGVAAGIGSIFKAPFGGAIFAIEVLYREDFEVEALIPAFISSAVSYSIYSFFFGFNPIFGTTNFAFMGAFDLVPYAILGLILAPAVIAYVKVFYGVRRIFKRIRIPDHFKPAIGGLLLGVLILFVPQTLGIGYGWIQLAIYGQIALVSLVVIGITKIIATSLTIGSGGSGGVFAPSLMIGGMLGGALGIVLNMISPTLFPQPGAFVIVGMGAFFAGAGHVPIAAIIMVFEMTRDYSLFVPAMVACTLTYLFVRGYTIYIEQVPKRSDSSAHTGEFNRDLLEQVSVGQIATKKVITVSSQSPVKEIAQLILSTGHMGYPVVDEKKLVGIVTYTDILKIPVKERETIKIGEIMSTKLYVIYPQDNVYSALYKMEFNNIGRVPVVNPDDSTQLLGIITGTDIIMAHEKIANTEGFRGKDVFFQQMLVKEIMCTDVVTVSTSTSISEFEEVINDTGHENYPVLDKEKIVGVATVKGLIRKLYKKEPIKTVSNIMHKKYLSIDGDKSVAEALLKMYESNMELLLVTNKSNPEKLAGVVTIADVIKIYISERILL